MKEVRIGKATIKLLRGDITEQQVDAVVNAANPSLMGGGGVDGAIHRKGGPDILAACKAIRKTRYPDGLPTGEAVQTTAGRLPAKQVIHTVGPIWRGGSAGEAENLARCYRHVLDSAVAAGLQTVAFPSISTGAYGYPLEAAAGIALQTVIGYLETDPNDLQEVRFVLFSKDDLQTYRKVLREQIPT